MTLKLNNQINNAAANTLLDPQARISSKHDINVTIGSADALAVLAVGYPMAYNESTEQYAPWMAPDPTVLVITLTGATGGTFTITVNSATTAALAYNASAAAVAAALKAIGYIATVALNTLVYTITFNAATEVATLPTVTADTTLIEGDITESVVVAPGTAQVPDPSVFNIDLKGDIDPTILNISLGVGVPATGGTFTVTYDGNTSAAIAWNASALTIETAVLAIGTHAPDTVKVTRDGLSNIAIYFNDIADLISLPTVSASVASITGATGEEALATVGTATTGTYTITVGALTTAAINFADSAGEIEAALAALATPVVATVVTNGIDAVSITFDSLTEVVTLPTVTLTDTAGAEGETVVGTAIVPDPSTIAVDVGTATGGTFTITVDGTTTAGIAFDATANAVDAAILLATGIVTTTILASTTYTSTFGALDEVVTLPALSGSIAGLTGAGIGGVATAGTATNGTDNIRGFVNPNDVQIGTDTGTAALVVLTGTDTVCTATTTNPHGLVTGMSLTFSGATETKLNITAAITVLTATTFTYTVAAVAGGTTDSGSYTTTNDIMAVIMVKGQIHAALPQSLVAASDVTALNTALKNGLVEKDLIVQGIAGRF